MCNVVRGCLVILVLAFVQIQVNCIAARRSPIERARRGVGKLNVETTAKDYMAQISDMLTDKDGKPKDINSAPTSVWCFLDKGN